MSVLVEQDVVAVKHTHTNSVMMKKLIQAKLLPPPHHPPVEVPVDDGLGEIVQVLHALGHVDGDDELGLQVDEPVH